MTTCDRCHGTGELVAVGNGRYLALIDWNGDEGDLIDCECKGEPAMTTDRTAQRERLARTLYERIERIGELWGEATDGYKKLYLGKAEAIMDEFPEIGQQPRLDPALRERIERAIRETYGAFCRLAGGAEERNESLTVIYRDCDKALAVVMALIDSIAPAAQPQIDRDDWEVLTELITNTCFRNKGNVGTVNVGTVAVAIQEAGFTRTPAAQPFPTRSQIRTLFEPIMVNGQVPVKYVHGALIAAGFAREDEPEPQTGVWHDYVTIEDMPYADANGQLIPDIVRARWASQHNELVDSWAIDEPEPQVGEVGSKEITRISDLLDDIQLAWDAIERCHDGVVWFHAKAVSEGGGE